EHRLRRHICEQKRRRNNRRLARLSILRRLERKRSHGQRSRRTILSLRVHARTSPDRSQRRLNSQSIYLIQEHLFLSDRKDPRGCNGVSIAEPACLRARFRKNLRERRLGSLLYEARKDLRGSS